MELLQNDFSCQLCQNIGSMTLQFSWLFLHGHKMNEANNKSPYQLPRMKTARETRSLLKNHFPGKSTGVGCHFFLQGIFPTQVLNVSLPHCRQTLYCLSNQGSPQESMTFYPARQPLIETSYKICPYFTQFRTMTYFATEKSAKVTH